MKINNNKRKYIPEIRVLTTNITNYKINNIENVVEVQKVIINRLKKTYLSTNELIKPIINIDTCLKIEIWSSSIQESFGKPEYYKKLFYENKIIKLAVIDYLAKMVKYGEIRAKDQPNYHNLNSPARYYYFKISNNN